MDRGMLHTNEAFRKVLTLAAFLLGACSPPTEVDVPLTLDASQTAIARVEPTPEPPPPKTLFVCLNQEPDSLYIYNDLYFNGDSGIETNAVLQAIYDGPIDLVDFQPIPIILERLPNLSRGEDARLEEVIVHDGELYLNPETLQPEMLDYGKTYMPSGCEGSQCLLTYEGGDVYMPRMVVEFHLLPDLMWSDGTPLTAADSVYSFELDRHFDTPTIKYMVDRTSSYEALEDGLSVRWTGIPGFIDSEYQTNFWHPLPMHVLAGFTPTELLTADEANQSVVGWGAYQIESWSSGQEIVLTPNPHYFRASEGLPHFDRLVFRFLNAESEVAFQQLLTGECDVLDESLISEGALSSLLELEQSGRLAIAVGPGPYLTRLDFNLSPVGDDFDRDLFADVRTREAIAGCIDRAQIAEDLYHGLASVPNSYISPDHPAYAGDADFVPYDVEAAKTMLETVGWVDEDGMPDTPRVAQGVPGVPSGTPLSFTFQTISGDIEQPLAEHLQSDLSDCGIEMTIVYQEAATFTASWPEGPIFGREFQTVGWAWPDWWVPLCEMFAGREIPTGVYPFGSNASGFNDSTYNAACEVILLGAPGTQAYDDAVALSQEVFVRELPAIPLYQAPRILATHPDVCGLEVVPLAFSGLWNIEVLDSGEDCEG